MKFVATQIVGLVKEFSMELTHFDGNGNAIMVDVSEKESTSRQASAKGRIKVSKAVIDSIQSSSSKKGDVLAVARVAGIMACKKTSELIPLCHNLNLTKVSIDFRIDEEKNEIEVTCIAKVDGKTGVEMEALTGASVSLLTIYDMCKAIDKNMVIQQLYLEEKIGGKSGHFIHGTVEK